MAQPVEAALFCTGGLHNKGGLAMQRNAIETDKQAYMKSLYETLGGKEAQREANSGGTQPNGEVSLAPRQEAVSEQDIVGLMVKNLGEMREYYLISQYQIKRSFVLACAMCVVGILLLATAVVIAIFSPAALTPAIVSGLSGVITLFIARTAFTLYNTTIAQLNVYYEALHKNEQLLMATYLIAKLPQDKRDEAYLAIIKDLIEEYHNKA